MPEFVFVVSCLEIPKSLHGEKERELDPAAIKYCEVDLYRIPH